jgi:biopolymer transport protein TolR
VANTASKAKLSAIRKELRKGKHRKGGRIQADINVTPLVDVVLVLLIIFMVVTPMITKGVQVDLPRTLHHDKKPDNGKDIIISVTKDKMVYLSGNRTQLSEIKNKVEEERRRFPEKTIYLKGDAHTTYGAVRSVMEAIHKANIDDIMLGTEDVKPSPQ